jgi:hypothetical protein
MRQDTDIRELVKLDEIDLSEIDEEVRNPVGRPRGHSPRSKRNNLTRRIAERALEEHRSPLEVMLEVQDWFRAECWRLQAELRAAPAPTNRIERAAQRYKYKLLIALSAKTAEIAAMAAVYVHPRLNAVSVEAGGSGDTPITFQIVADDARL